MRLPASSDGRHDGNTITVSHRSGFLLQVADILVIYINIDEGPEFTVIGIQMAAQVRVLGDEVGKGISYSSGLHVYGRLLAGVLAQGGWDMDFGHTCSIHDAIDGAGDSGGCVNLCGGGAYPPQQVEWIAGVFAIAINLMATSFIKQLGVRDYFTPGI